MKVYTIKDSDGNLYPQAFLAIPNLSEAVIDGAIVQVDYGLDSAKEYVKKSNGELSLAVCELIENQ